MYTALKTDGRKRTAYQRSFVVQQYGEWPLGRQVGPHVLVEVILLNGILVQRAGQGTAETVALKGDIFN